MTDWLRPGGVLAAAFVVLLLQGCAAPETNPSFPLTLNQAMGELRRMEQHPKRLARPLLVISGLLDPGVAAVTLESDFRQTTGDPRIAAISLFECTSFEQCRQKIIEVTDRAFPCDDPNQTSEVDVVGFSMGGLAARLAADPPDAKRRLRICRLFTIDSPNQGADRARQLPLLYPLQADMRSGSAMLVRLNRQRPDYSVVCYVRLGDKPVGPPNAAVPGQPLWWVPTPPMSNPHMGAFDDPRIVADIARRLRGEKPFTSTPPAPLPPDK